jgi:hypothetical protein
MIENSSAILTADESLFSMRARWGTSLGLKHLGTLGRVEIRGLSLTAFMVRLRKLFKT